MGVDAARPHPKMWAWLHLEPPLLRFLELTTGAYKNIKAQEC